jgi:surfactin synthase thioesterase subunit
MAGVGVLSGLNRVPDDDIPDNSWQRVVPRVTAVNEGRWSICFEKMEAPQIRVFCFPHAGGGVQAYRDWSEALIPGKVEVHAINLPGRGSRQAEVAKIELRVLVNSVVDAISPLLNLPYAIFGHSWGSVLGFEVLCELRRRDLPLASLLLVSAHKAPHACGVEPSSWTHELDDKSFVHAATKWCV